MEENMVWVRIGVNIDGLTEQMNEAVRILDKTKKDCFITSGTEGLHMPGSRHYSGNAIDIRTLDFTKNELSLLLGREYDVVQEKDHIHIEYDRKIKA
jgi:hypothetical protein